MQSKLLTLCLGMICLVPASRAATNTVVIGNYFFNPTNLTINVGDTVRWTNAVANSTSGTHDVTRTNQPFTWASPDMTASSRVYFLTFSTAGAFPYFCNRHVYASLLQNRHPEQTGTVSVVSIALPPAVSLTNPSDNFKYLAPANILLQASASDDGAVTNVQFFSGPALLGSAATAPFAFTLNNAAAGIYSFTARAQDNSGLSATSTVVNVFVLTNAILTAPTLQPGGQFQLTIQGIAGQTYNHGKLPESDELVGHPHQCCSGQLVQCYGCHQHQCLATLLPRPARPLSLSVRNGGGFEDFRHDRIGKITTDREAHLEFAVGVNDQGAKVVIVEIALRGRGDIGGLREFCDLVGRPGDETPVLRIVMITPGVGCQNARRVKGRIERYGKEMPVGRRLRQRAKFLGRLPQNSWKGAGSIPGWGSG